MGVGDSPTSTSPQTPPLSLFRLASTASNLSICSRTATPVVPGWTFEYVVENGTSRVELGKSADPFEGKPKATTRSLGLEKLSRGGGAWNGTVLMEAWGDLGQSSWSSNGSLLLRWSSSSLLNISWVDSSLSFYAKTLCRQVSSRGPSSLKILSFVLRGGKQRSGLPHASTIGRCSMPVP